MADCDLTFDVLDPDDDPVENGAIGVAAAVMTVTGAGKMIAAEKFYALSDPFNTETFVRGELYRWREYKPKGQTFYAYCPNVAAANYSDLVPVPFIPATGGIFGDTVVDAVISNPASESYATLEAFIADHPGPAGPGGPAGPPGGSDAATANWIAAGVLTPAALGTEADDPTAPLGTSIQGAALVAALIYGGN